MNRKKLVTGNNTMSLITSCCDGNQYLKEWADSILAQKYRPLEVVFFDDKSKDKSRASILKVHFPRFKQAGISTQLVAYEKKAKYGGGLYHSTQKAKGSFFGILDADDALEKGSVEYIMDLYKRYPNIAYIWTQFESYDCKMVENLGPGFSRAPRKGQSILSEGLQGNHVYSHFRSWSTRVPNHLDILPIRGKFAVDQYMALKLEEKSPGMFADRVCYKYRSGCVGTISHNYGARRRTYWAQMCKDVLQQRKTDSVIPYPIIEAK